MNQHKINRLIRQVQSRLSKIESMLAEDNSKDGEMAIRDTTSILSGRCAVQVNNEREFKLLMQHMNSKGWVWNDKSSPLSEFSTWTEFPFRVWYEDNFAYGEAVEDDYRKLIPFADFAAEIGIEIPKFIIKSEDNVDLYEGDEYHEASFSTMVNEWQYIKGKNHFLSSDHRVAVEPVHNKAFSTKEAAEKWIRENNPKDIIIDHTGGNIAINKLTVTFNTDERCFSAQYFKKIVDAFNSLQ